MRISETVTGTSYLVMFSRASPFVAIEENSLIVLDRAFYRIKHIRYLLKMFIVVN